MDKEIYHNFSWDLIICTDAPHISHCRLYTSMLPLLKSQLFDLRACSGTLHFGLICGQAWGSNEEKCGETTNRNGHFAIFPMKVPRNLGW